MSLNVLIIRQLIVSSVLLSAFKCSSAVRFSRSMQYPAPSMRKYTNPWNYIQFMQMPRSMQRRFMWKDMDDTVDGLMGNVANGARPPMTQVFSPSMIRYRKPFEFDVQPSKKVKYIIKKPPVPPPPPFKRMKVIKFRSPKQHQQSIPLYNHVTIAEPPSVIFTTTSEPLVIMSPFMSQEEIRKIEKEQEKRVESESADADAGGIHEHSHQTHMDDDIVRGRINEFGEDWLPMKGPFSTPKAFAVSRLHTKVEAISTIPPPAPTALPLVLSEPFKNKFSYEVTEHSAEASDQQEQAFKPSTFNFDFLAATTEGPNYPEYFLKTFSKNENDGFQPKRVPITTTTTSATTTITTQSSRRLPPRSTTEHPFKRYNLHRPKPSKLLFHRSSTSSPNSTKHTQTATTTTTESSYKVTLELHQEPVKTTRESIRTTTSREPSTTTTKEPIKKSPPEKVRTTRMNNSEVKSKLRIKNVSQNESLNKVLNKHRGSVKFGEKTKSS